MTPDRHKNVALFIPHAGCPHQCSFCNQRTISGALCPPRPQEVRQTLLQASEEIQDKSKTEIAFFGGSFTALDPDYMSALLEEADAFPDFAGVRISTRPDAITPKILGVLKKHRVTSIELGAQSMEDEVLAANGRGHTAQDVREASRLIREMGFSLGLQMMLGLYQDTPDGVVRTARALSKLRPDTMRIYPAVVLEGTELARLFQAGLYQPMALSEAVRLGAELLAFFEETGIRVIRMGLHASEDIQAHRVAGPYHPAYRELCEGFLYLRAAREALAELPCKGEVTLWVHPKAISKMVGQRRENLKALEKDGWHPKVAGDPALSPYQVRAEGLRR